MRREQGVTADQGRLEENHTDTSTQPALRVSCKVRCMPTAAHLKQTFFSGRTEIEPGFLLGQVCNAMNLASWLQSLPEQRLYIIIEDLLRAMQFKRVECVHGPGEVGKDIVFMYEDPLHREIWKAAQIKTKLTGAAGSSGYSLTALLQCEAALRNSHQTSHVEVGIQEVWLITSYPLGDLAKRHIDSQLNNTSSRIVIIDGPQLVDLIQEYLPNLLQQGKAPSEDYLTSLMSFCDLPDELLVLAFHAKFSLGNLYIPPDLSVDLIRTEFLKEIPKYVDTVDWNSLVKFQEDVVLLQAGLLPLFRIFELRTNIERLGECRDIMRHFRWSPTDLSEVVTIMDKLTETVRKASKDPNVTQEMLAKIESDLCEIEDAKLDPIRHFHKVHEGEELDIRVGSKLPSRPRWGSRTEDHEKLHSARDKVYKNLLHAYTKSTDRTHEYASLALQTCELLAKPRRAGINREIDDEWSLRLNTLQRHVTEFSTYLESLKASYFEHRTNIKIGATGELMLQGMSSHEIDALTRCNELTPLLASILGEHKCTGPQPTVFHSHQRVPAQTQFFEIGDENLTAKSQLGANTVPVPMQFFKLVCFCRQHGRNGAANFLLEISQAPFLSSFSLGKLR